jgi:lysylphosphatidylglycerol synthetase-like protein (DUF2156 family)
LIPFRHADHKKYFIARADGKLVGFLAASPVPVRKGWYLEDVLREPDAPAGTATLLVFEALQSLRKDGAELATLGTTPLASDGPNEISTEHLVVRACFANCGQGVLAASTTSMACADSKTKFAPSWWESEYVVAQRGIAIPPRVANAIMRALVPRGLPQLLSRQALRLIRRKQRSSSRTPTQSIRRAKTRRRIPLVN